MLILSRKLGERIVMPENQLTIVVDELTGNSVRLGISSGLDSSAFGRSTWTGEGRKSASVSFVMGRVRSVLRRY